MMNRRRQRGFLLNPFRHAGTVQSGAASMDGASAFSLSGASVVSAAASADGSAAFVCGSDQAAAGAFSASGAGGFTMSAAATAASAMSASGAADPILYGSGGALTIDAADYDGSNDYMRRASGMTGQADSKLGTLVFWIYPDVHSKYLFYAPGAGSGGSVIIVDIDSGVLSISCDGETFSGIAFMQSTIAVPTTGWTCVMSSWNTGTSTGRLYFGDTDRYNAGTASWTDANIDYSAATAWEVGTAFNSTGFAFNGGLAEFWFDPTVAIDFSIEANRRLFYGADGKPVDLGSTGATPTGTDPLIYCHISDGETANNFAINRGTGGNFTVTGSLTTYASSPSD